MTTAGFGTLDGLPASVLAAQEREQRLEDREARRQAAEDEAAIEARRDQAIAAYVAAASARGETIGATDIARGDLGRTLDEILAGASGELADRVPAHQREHDWDEIIVDATMVRRSRREYDASGYETDRLLRQATELHRDFVAVRARHDYPAAVERARKSSTEVAQRGAYGDDGAYPEIRR